jgi:poly-gamma-glutamate synthesis protein (capsule biosynthesis protein)
VPCIGHAGAGRNAAEAAAPGRVELRGGGRVLVFAFATPTSGVPETWAATGTRPGVDLLADLSSRTVAGVRARVEACKRPGDVAVASLHWSGNWATRRPPTKSAWLAAVLSREGRRFGTGVELTEEGVLRLVWT